MSVFVAFVAGYFLGGVSAVVLLAMAVAARDGDREQATQSRRARKKDAEITRL